MSRINAVLLSTIILGSMLGGCSSGCSNQEEQTQSIWELPKSDPLVLIIKNRADTTSAATAVNLGQAFNYTKIPFTTFDLSFASYQFSIPKSIRLVCLTTGELESMSKEGVEKLVEFVAEGNNVLTTTPVWDPRFAYLLGIKPNSDYEQEQEANGFQFHQTVFPGFDDGSFTLPVPYYHRGFSMNVFVDSIDVIASSKDSLNAPVIVENRIGDGHSILFNSQIGFEKDYRGILFSLALKMLEGVPYPVANTSTIFLDDFPSPLYNRKMPPIDWEYDITHAEFVSKVWWPDMQALADTFDIDYSAMIAFNYNANVVPPFDFDEWTNSKVDIPGEADNGSIGLAEEVVASRHELALHGYNHFSLWLQDWPNEQFMIAALQAARKRWGIDNLGPLPVTYVPPTNLIDSTGIDALAKAMPQIKYMSSLYIGDPETGGGREFGPDPYNPNLFDYPRITSGFIADDNSMFKQQSLYIVSGIWTHFIHPDDVFHIEQSAEDIFPSRNERGLGWHRNKELDYGLYEVFKRRLEQTIKDYPHIRFKTAKDAVPIVKGWRSSQTYRYDSTDNNRVIIDNINFVQRQRDTLGNPSYWFMYVNNKNRKQVEKALASEATDIVASPMWDGYLIQFVSNRDTLKIPNLYQQRKAGSDATTAIVSKVLSEYQSYQNQVNKADQDTAWTDTRLQDALAELRRNPQSRSLQDEVINLSIEFDRIELAITLLENRLMQNSTWHSEDLSRLVTYYGWGDTVPRAWSFLEKLWNKYRDESVIALKNMMTTQYGVPDLEFREKWLKRELTLHPHDEKILAKLVRYDQSQENWPYTKNYLKQLIRLNPASDTLYHYSIQRSLWYSQPDSTIQWLNSFPESAGKQLIPLSDQIANLYAYSKNDYDQALFWAQKSDKIGVQTKLQWLLQANRTQDFQDTATSELSKNPDDDSLRIFVGKELIYEGNYDEGYETLYPLFSEGSAPQDVTKLVQTEIGYMSYEQKKKFYKRYPSFFADEQQTGLQQQYRINEGVTGGLRGSYTTDNFDNTQVEGGITAEWGNRQKEFHTLDIGRSIIQSKVNNNSSSDNLTSLNYRYQRRYHQQTMQSTLGVGISLTGQDVLPEFLAGLWVAGDSTYTSGEVSYAPVMTNTAIRQDINQVKGTFYREDYWGKRGRLMSTFSASATWYTDKVFAYEGVGRLYFQMPFSTAVFRTRAIGELGFIDATNAYDDGLPYWTTNNLAMEGAGLDTRYRDRTEDPRFSILGELMEKHDRDGFYLTSAIHLNATIAKYWQISLDAELSSSKLYRSNNVGFSIEYTFPTSIKQ